MQNLSKEKEQKRIKALQVYEKNKQSVRHFLTTIYERDIALVIREYDDYVKGLTDEEQKLVEEKMYGSRVYGILCEEPVVNYSIVKHIVQLEQKYDMQFSGEVFAKVYENLYAGFEQDPGIFWVKFNDVLKSVDKKVRVNPDEKTLIKEL